MGRRSGLEGVSETEGGLEGVSGTEGGLEGVGGTEKQLGRSEWDGG